MSLRPHDAPPRLLRESLAVGLGALVVAAVALRVPLGRLGRGVIGHGDAWQNVWNLRHVDRALRGEARLLFTRELWAPEGASLAAHTLALPFSGPGALLSRAVGYLAAYDALVLLSFALAAVGLHRLARRMGASAVGSAAGAAVFAFSPQRFARALGHLNLLGIGWLALALEGLWVACRARGAARLAAAALGGLALAALALTDWYLALLGVLAAGSLFVFEIARARDRRGVAAAFATAALVSAAIVAPSALALRRETAGLPVAHEAQWCSSAVTSLVVPSRTQLASRLTRRLTERNHQGQAEAAAYLGLVPLAATLWVSFGRRRVRALDFALAAGAAALVLALGPRLRVFDRLLDVPLPYALLERLVPALKAGGCTNRFVALASLPLALGTAFAATRLLASGSRGARAAFGAALAALAVEYAPADPGFSVIRPDAAVSAIASSSDRGSVLDVQEGIGPLVRQLGHGRPLLTGYLSRTPPASLARRLEDPVVGPLLDPSRPPFPVPPAAAAALLRDRWGASFVAVQDGATSAPRAEALGFPLLARAPGLSIAYRVPDEPLPPLSEVQIAETADPSRAPSRGAFAWGMEAPSAVAAFGREYAGRWAGEESGLLAPLAAGRYALLVAAPASPASVVVRWGRARELRRTVSAPEELALSVTTADLAGDGTLLVSIAARPFASGGGREVLFVVSLRRAD